MKIFYIVSIFVFINVNVAFSIEYVCVFDTMLTSDVMEYSPNYEESLNIKSKSKFVFDITDESLMVNGEEYISVFTSSGQNRFSVYSNKDFPYVMFHFYPSDNTLIMIGMQESSNDTFLKSDALTCFANESSRIIPKSLSKSTPLNDKLKNLKQNDSLAQKKKEEEEEEEETTTKEKTPTNEETKEIIIPPPT